MLRPVLFKILSTTQLKIGFNLPVIESIGVGNFKIEAISGSDSDVEILSVQIDSKSITLNTRPHHSKAYYVLKLLDSASVTFTSINGLPLINDDLSRDIYFIGIDKANQIRDDLHFKTPAIYNLDDTVVGSIIGTQADYLLDAQHAIGSLLNDNYISQQVTNEYRVRCAGALDRLANENAYEINRVSLSPSGSSVSSRTIEISNTNIYPINLRQELIESYSIDSTNSISTFNGFLLSLPEKNIIKVISAKLIKPTDIADCDGNTGTIYDLSKYKYGLYNNRYDQLNALSNKSIESNQVLFSDFGNWLRPERDDTIIVSYYYDNAAILIVDSSIGVYTPTAIVNESIPSNSRNFSLQHGLIIDSIDEQPELGGVIFKESENSEAIPSQFFTELKYNFSSLPASIGAYSINYETGDVFVVGDQIGEGTGFNYLFADYTYKKEYKRNLDFSVLGSELNLNYLRPLFGKSIKIVFDYETVFAEGTDYNSMVHKEVLGEQVANRVTSSFSLETQFSPITDVFRIYNQTTGEIYALNYFSGNEIFFTGNTLPSAKEVTAEPANFVQKSGQEITASGVFISPVHYGTVTSNASNLNIEFSPGLPSELIDELSTTYVVRFLNQDLDDATVTAFYSANGNGLIGGLSISSLVTIPNVGTSIQIGVSSLIFELEDNRILNSTGDGFGSVVNSSLELDTELFISEKFFTPISNSIELTLLSSGSQTYAINSDQIGELNKNLSRLRIAGDYCADYQNGVLYVAVNDTKSFSGGLIAYSTSSTLTQNKNIIAVNKAYREIAGSTEQSEYSSISFTSTEIKISDIADTIESYDGSTIINDNGQEIETLLVDEFYQATVSNKISSIRFISELKDLVGKDLDSTILSERYPNSDSSELLLLKSSSGKNLYIAPYVSFSGRTIDFKTTVTSKIYTIGSTQQIKFRTPDMSSIYAVYDAGGNVILDASLRFEVISDMGVLSITNYSSTEFKVSFDSIDSRYSFNSGYDHLSDGIDSWLVTGFGSGYFIINKLSELYESEFSGDTFNVSIGPVITGIDEITITYPASGFLTSNSLATISYITTYSPTPGTALAVEYSSGSIFFDYVAMNDELVVYYEYGDNEIDWSINSSISEGQSYFVDYKYGALRGALRRNFGRLTAIPFFDNDSLSIDRELYRDAVGGVLSAYPRGPTIPAISGLVESIVKTVPKIEELTFGSWILGRDYLTPGPVSSSGPLEFVDGKFGSGLNINGDNSIWIPAASSISLDEGTVEMWITPSWNGIHNDADLTFSFDNIGTSNFYYSGGDPFSTKSGYSVIGSPDTNDERHGFDASSGGKLVIYKVSTGSDGYVAADFNSLFGIYKNDLALDRETSLLQKVEFSINYSYLPRNSTAYGSLVDSGAYFAGGIVVDNAHNMFNLKIIGSTVKTGGNTRLFTVSGLDSDILSDFAPPYPTVACNCVVVGQNSVLENFDNLEIEITPSVILNRSDLLPEAWFGSETCRALMIVDNFGRFYEVTGLVGIDDRRVASIPQFIKSIFVSRYPINYPELSAQSFDVINEVGFSQFVIVKQQLQLDLKATEKSSSYFSQQYLWNFNWTDKTKLSLYLNPVTNEAWIKSTTAKYSFFYTDLPETDLLSAVNDTVSANSSAIGVYGISSMNLFKSLITLDYKFGLDDVFIGSGSSHPVSKSFTLNRLDSDIDVNGISHFSDTRDGIYIGYDSDCLSPINENIGQWILRTRFLKYSQLPYDVMVIDGSLTNLLEYVAIDTPITGSIQSSGQFSSITKGRRSTDASCTDTATCSKSFRFLGNKLIDSDGWSLLQESESVVIDHLNGGREVESFSWRKIGQFDTEVSSGIYRVNAITAFEDTETYFSNSIGLTVENSCYKGNVELIVSAKIVSFDADTLLLSLDPTVRSSGIVIAEINSIDYDLGVSLDSDIFGNGLISLVDLASLQKLKTQSFNWNDSSFHKYAILIDRTNSLINISTDDAILLQYDLSLVSVIDDSATCLANKNSSFSSMAVDQRLIESDTYFASVTPPIIDFNLVEANTNYNPGTIKLEDSDIFIVSGSLATFELHPNPNEFDEIVSDGYITESDIDEIMITSDNDKYLLDTGVSEDSSRLSIFKDGKGFLNFRIIDSKEKSPGIFNIATNVKSFVANERHHVAASWKLNSSFERDELHLFVDGQEVPSLFKFGGYAPIKFNSKFSDISEENLYNYAEKKVIFSAIITDGIVAANSNELSSTSLTITSDLLGRSIIFDDSSSLNGKLLVIIGTGAGFIELGDATSLEPYIFSASESSVGFSLVPYSDSIFTDLRNDRFSVFRTGCDGISEELGGLGYTTDDGVITISNIPSDVSYRYNKTLGIIEFVKQDNACNYVSSVDKTDIKISIRTYGLAARRCKNIFSLSGTSLFLNEGSDPVGTNNSRAGYSIVATTGPRPKNLADVSIQKYSLYNYSIGLDTVEISGADILSNFEIMLDDTLTSLETINVSKINDGRYFEIQIDSDNIYFDRINTLSVHGVTPSGSVIEDLLINKNGSFFTQNRYTSLEKITGSFNLIDVDYDFVSLVSVIETNSIFVQDGTGDYADIYRFSNGAIFLSIAGSDPYVAFELPPGYYVIDYSASLHISIPQIGDKLFIGTDITESKQLLGSVDDFVILNTMLKDLRPWESSVSGTRTVTEDFFKENPNCITSSTLALIGFENPIEKQSRRLRNKRFLDTQNNFTYGLSVKDRDILLSHINNESEFVSYMIFIGYSKDTAEALFFECNMAESGPLYNLASYTPTIGSQQLSPNSVNSSFKQSGRFENSDALILSNNNNLLRNGSGTIEFWYQPKLDTFNDGDSRTLFESSSVLAERVVSVTPYLLRLPNPASKIISVKLISSGRLADASYYSSAEKSSILFNEISLSESTGRYSKGTGTDKDFSLDSVISPDGLSINLIDALPGGNVDVIVTYVPRQFAGEKISIYKDQFSRLIARIESKDFAHLIPVDISWAEETWHRISLSYNFVGTSKFIKFFVDGIVFDTIYAYGKDVYPTVFDSAKIIDKVTFSLVEQLSQVIIGNNYEFRSPATGLIDNFRLSREARTYSIDAAGVEIDINYSANTDQISPVGTDDLTTYLQNFDYDDIEREVHTATIIDPVRGVFDFDVKILDDFDRVIGINNGAIEDLVVDLISRLKPAHSNANVRFIEKKCKE